MERLRRSGALWLTQKLMAERFQKVVRTINEHLKNIFAEGKLNEDSVIRKLRIVPKAGARRLSEAGL